MPDAFADKGMKHVGIFRDARAVEVHLSSDVNALGNNYFCLRRTERKLIKQHFHSRIMKRSEMRTELHLQM